MRHDLNDNRSDNQTCESLAPFLMALFDGEADELEARRARAHLLICQTCARRWLDWNHARTLIQGIPVEAPPPTLLWRLLLACRLEAFSKRNRSKRTAETPSFAPDALRAQILARTTRVSMPVATPSARQRRVWSSFALPSLAVPALAMWMIVLQRDTLFTPITIADTSNAPVAASPISQGKVSHASTSPRFHKAVSARHIAAEPVQVVAEATNQNTRKSLRPLVLAALPHRSLIEQPGPLGSVKPHPSPATEIPDNTDETLGRFLEANLTGEVASAPGSGSSGSTHLASAVPTRRLVVVAPRAAAIGKRSASFSDAADSPHLRLTRWKASTPRAYTLAETASPTPSPSRVSMPSTAAPAPVRLIAENLDVDSQGVDEMRSVVDDYRASLAPDSASDDSTSDDSAG